MTDSTDTMTAETARPEMTDYSCARGDFTISGTHPDEIAAAALLHDSVCTRHSYIPASPATNGRFTVVSPDAPALITQLAGRIRRRAGWWGRDATTTLIGALVPVAPTFPGHFVEGWPVWLPRVVFELYEADTDTEDQQRAASAWVTEIAPLLASPIDYTAVRHLLLRDVLGLVIDPGKPSHSTRAADLHVRAVDGDAPSEDEWMEAYVAASNDAFAADTHGYDRATLAWLAMDACSPYQPESTTWITIFQCGSITGTAGRISPALIGTTRKLLLDAMRSSLAE